MHALASWWGGCCWRSGLAAQLDVWGMDNPAGAPQAAGGWVCGLSVQQRMRGRAALPRLQPCCLQRYSAHAPARLPSLSRRHRRRGGACPGGLHLHPVCSQLAMQTARPGTYGCVLALVMPMAPATCMCITSCGLLPIMQRRVPRLPPLAGARHCRGVRCWVPRARRLRHRPAV